MHQLQEGANDARSTDVSRVKSAVGDWLNDRVSDPTKRFDRLSREGRGIQNDMTGRLLCSLSLDWENPVYAGREIHAIPQLITGTALGQKSKTSRMTNIILGKTSTPGVYTLERMVIRSRSRMDTSRARFL
jgi:hypothetical protein